MTEISLSTNEFKALSSESRTKILKLLDQRNHTLSELSSKTNMAAPTIKQHAAILIQSGLIELKDEGRKWKYYSLTRKGKELVGANKTPHSNILIILSTATMIAILGIAIMFTNTHSGNNYNEQGSDSATISSPASEKTAADSMTMMVANNCLPKQIEGQKTPEQYYKRCTQAKTEEECAHIDYYSRATGYYESGDGETDCEWIEFEKS